MVYQIQEVSEADFPALVRCMWDTYENPLQGLFRIFSPENANGCETREESIEESIRRFWEWHVSDESSHWLKVVNTEDGKIVGGALWKLHESNPYETAPQEQEAYWHPPGGQREFANQALAQHEDLNILLTHPDHRRRGIGTQLVEWGIDKASEMDVEMWLDAWRYGRPLYEKHGFVTVEHHITQPRTANPDDAFKRCQREFTDLEEWIMWRPRGGPYVEGQSVKPWESS